MSVTFTPASVSCGKVQVGLTTTATVSVANSDPNNAVTLTKSGTDSAAFTFTPSSVAAGQTTIVTVSFKPTAERSFTASLDVGATSCALSGEGTRNLLDGTVTEDIGDHDSSSTTPDVVTRMAITVPFLSTTLTMGRGVVGTTYNGFGLATQGNIFLSADGGGSDTNSTFWAQSSGSMVMESINADVLSLAKGNNFATAAGSVNVLGGGGVFIAAGEGKAPVRADATNPPDPSGYSSLGQNASRAALGVAIFDALLAGVVTVRGIALMKDAAWSGAPFNKKFNTVVSVFPILAGLTATALGTTSSHASRMSLQGKSTDISLPGVTIWGQAGVLVATPAFCSIYGGTGLVMGSLYPFICGVDVETFGLKSAALTAIRDATVQATKKATLKSSKHVDILANNRIKAGVTGAYSMVINANGVQMGNASPTLGILGNNKFWLTDDTMTIQESRVANFKARQRVEVGVQAVTGYSMTFEATKLEMGKGNMGRAPVMTMTDNEIALSPRAGVRQGGISLKADVVTVGFPTRAFVKCESNNYLTLSGTKIEIG